MKKQIVFIFLSIFIASFARGQTSDRFQFTHNGKILFDPTIQRPAPIHDTVSIKLPCDSPIVNPPSASSYGRLYIDKLSSRLGIAAEESKVIKYTIQTGHSGWIEYDLSSIVGDATKEAQLRSLHVRARAAGILIITAVSSGGASSVASRISFNSRCTRPEEKFNILNEEWEPWNQADILAAAGQDSVQLKNQFAKARAAGMTSEEYWGWLKKFYSIRGFFPMLIKNTDQLPLHYYQPSVDISYHGPETDTLNKYAKQLNIVYNLRPIFSSELAFSQNELKTKTPAQLYAKWKASFDAKHYSNLKSDGWDMFDMTYLEFAIPYRLPASASAARAVPMLINKAVNGTTDDHMKLSQDPDAE